MSTNPPTFPITLAEVQNFDAGFMRCMRINRDALRRSIVIGIPVTLVVSEVLFAALVVSGKVGKTGWGQVQLACLSLLLFVPFFPVMGGIHSWFQWRKIREAYSHFDELPGVNLEDLQVIYTTTDRARWGTVYPNLTFLAGGRRYSIRWRQHLHSVTANHVELRLICDVVRQDAPETWALVRSISEKDWKLINRIKIVDLIDPTVMI